MSLIQIRHPKPKMVGTTLKGAKLSFPVQWGWDLFSYTFGDGQYQLNMEIAAQPCRGNSATISVTQQSGDIYACFPASTDQILRNFG